MKKTIFLASLILGFHFTNAQESITSPSQPAKTNKESSGKKLSNQASPEQKAESFLSKLTEVVPLEDKQRSKVKSLALDHFNMMASVRKNAKGDKEKIKAEAKNSRAIFNEGLKKVLSPEQYETWRAKRKEVAQENKGKKLAPPAEDSLVD
jgi:hypothetical protein